MNNIFQIKNKIAELMHGKKKRLLSTVYSYIGKGLSKPLARVHPGYTFALGSEAENINV